MRKQTYIIYKKGIKNIDINSLLETGDSLVLTGEMSSLKKIAPEFIAK